MCFSTAGGTRQEAFLQTDGLSLPLPPRPPLAVTLVPSATSAAGRGSSALRACSLNTGKRGGGWVVDTASGNQRGANGEPALREGVRASVCMYKRASERASSPLEKHRIKGGLTTTQLHLPF